MVKRARVECGDEVKDPVTGIAGIAFVRLQYIQGCDRIGIQEPTIRKKGEAALVPELYHVDEPQLHIVKRGKIKRQTQKGEQPGGPSFFGKNTKR